MECVNEQPCGSFACSLSYVAEAAKDLDVPVYNIAGETVGQTTLPGDIFGVPVRRDILHRVVRWQLAKRQQVSRCMCAHFCCACWSTYALILA